MQTPFESNSGASWTSRTDGDSFLSALAAATDARLVQLGQSVESRPIWAIEVGAAPGPGVDVVMYVAAQHGNEPAPREAAYALARDMAQATGDLATYLGDVCWLILPTANPDRILQTRNNAAGANINSNFAALTQPEAAAIHAAAHQYEAVIVIDAHEGSFDAEMAAAYTTAPAVTSTLRGLSEAAVLSVSAAADAAGKIYMDFVGADGIGNLRNAAGLWHALGVLIETHQNPTNDINAPSRDFALRVNEHRMAAEWLRLFHVEHAVAIRDASDASRYPLGPPGGGTGSSHPLGIRDVIGILNGRRIIDAVKVTSAGRVRVEMRQRTV